LTLFGEVTFSRRRWEKQGCEAVYALDKFLGLKKYMRYSLLLQRNIAELATKMTYRSCELAVGLLLPFTLSHHKINKMVITLGQDMKKQQNDKERYDEDAPKKKVATLYIEGDGVVIKMRGGKMGTIHRFQVCEGKIRVGKKRYQLVNAHFTSSMSRKKAYDEMLAYIHHTYDLKNTTVISNSDGGSGYEKEVFDELGLGAKRQEYFRDAYHVNEKIKTRLSYLKEIQPLMLDAVWAHDWEKVEIACDTGESLVIDQTNAKEILEDLNRLKAYLERSWEEIKPFHLREFDAGIRNCVGTCESNHRAYPYRMKRQRRYWTQGGAEAMVRLIDAKKNHELDYWLGTDFETTIKEKEVEKKVRTATRHNTSRHWNGHDEHLGVVFGTVNLNGRGYFTH
jgi:hypothetical protein